MKVFKGPRIIGAFVVVVMLAIAQTGMSNSDKESSRNLKPQELTASDQGDSASDIDTTRKIRQALVANESLSSTAKNVTIITREGNVTIKGTVTSQPEKDSVLLAAQQVAGNPARVHSYLSIVRENASKHKGEKQ